MGPCPRLLEREQGEAGEGVVPEVRGDVLRDPVGNVRKLAQFVRQPFSPTEEEAGVAMDTVRLCNFDTLRNLGVNKAAAGSSSSSPSPSSSPFANDSYFRKGEDGDWANHVTPDMARRLDAVVEEKLRGSGLSFA
ncbi:unnamed protein product [Urochloa decumbens]|uniref:Sulfotransferase n=1 Tax=Urochloa decumbens TaxID=240449 RepID=A0ABC9C1L5_9POAL